MNENGAPASSRQASKMLALHLHRRLYGQQPTTMNEHGALASSRQASKMLALHLQRRKP